ncbi:MAG: site-specific integrase [Meiothermus sp.]
MPTNTRKRAARQVGHIRLRSDGRWECRFYVTDDDGTRRRVSVFAPTQAEAVKRAREVQVQHERGLLSRPDRRSLEAFALEVLARVTRGKAPNTARNYKRELALALEHLGQLPLQKVTPRDIRGCLDAVAERYSPRTVGKVLVRLRGVFREALALELIARDPTAAVRLARASERTPTAQHLEPHQVRVLLEYAEDSKSPDMALLLRLLVQLGLRRGEALALTWSDIDFAAGTLRVERQHTLQGTKPGVGPLKTRAARRVIPLPQDLLARLEARYQEHRQLLGPGVGRAFVFGVDQPLDINAPNHYLRRLVQSIQLEHPDFPEVRIHDLRHTAASLLLARGLDVALVAERLGHAGVGVTMAIYRHLLQEERQQAALPLDVLLGGSPHKA